MKKIWLMTLAIVLLVGCCAGCGARDNGDGTSSADETNAPKDFPKLTYEEYNALSAEEQERYLYQFEDLDAFFVWFNAAKKEYEERNTGDDIIIDGDVTLDPEEIFGKNP